MNHTRTTATVLVLLLVAAGMPLPVAASGSVQSQDCTFPVTITDAKGNHVTIEKAPERIVSLNPSAAQTLWVLGAREKVVGISEWATYLDGAEQKEIVNTLEEGIIVEKIIALEPDLVIAPGTIPNETIQNLNSKGLTVVAFGTPSSIAGVADKTTKIGRITGYCTEAAEVNDWMHTNVERVRNAVADEPHPRAMYVFYGYTVGSETFIHDMMASAGLTNIMATAGITGYAQANPEVVRERNPEWIIVNSGDPGVPDSPAYNETIAVQQDQIVTVNINYMNQPAPRSVVMAVWKMASTIHSDAMADIELAPREQFQITTTTKTAEPTQTTTEPAQTTATTTPTEATTSAPAPGLGLTAGIVALLAGLLFTRREA